MAVSQALTITQVSQSVANKTSTIRILWTTTQTGTSYNDTEKIGYYWVSVNGGAETRYTVYSTLPLQSTKTIVDTTLVVHHDSNGECTVSVRTSMNTNISAGTVTLSKSLTLDKIYQASTLTASNGTLGTAQTLTISSYDSTFKHSIRYNCGTASGTVCTKVSDTDVSFTPPEGLATQNTSGSTVQVTLTLYTFDGDTEIGQTQKTITCTIPANIKPSCSISYEEFGTNHLQTYGAFVQGETRLKVTITPELAYNSPIVAYTSTANGSRYNSSVYYTDILKNAGDMVICAAVTDNRNRSGTDEITIAGVMEYSPPVISSLSVIRCDADGTENDQGEYCQVSFTGWVSDLYGHNSCWYTLKYKQVSEEQFTTVTLPELDHVTSEISYSCTPFIANSGSAYDVTVSVQDDFHTASKSTSVSTAETVMHLRSDGTAVCFGGISTRANSHQINKPIYDRFDTVIANGLATYDGDGNNGIDPNDTIDELCLTSHENAPQGLGVPYFIRTAFYSAKSETADRAQIAFPYNKNGSLYHRCYKNGGWTQWSRYMTIDEVYPINSIYISYSHTSPSDLFGGIWQRMTNCFLWGSGPEEAIGETGGEKTHTLTISEIPEHDHKVDGRVNGSSAGAGAFDYSASWPVESSKQTDRVGGGEAHNNMPPYVNVSIWRRVA